MIDLLLVNSLAPRQRSISDTALENSLAVLRTYLEDRGYGVEVLDFLRLDELEQGVPQWCFAGIRYFVGHQMRAYLRGAKLLPLLFMVPAWPLQEWSVRARKRHMTRIVDSIVAKVREDKVPFVGIKVWYGESFLWSLSLASALKKHCPDTIVIAGGPQVNVYREKTLEKTGFDLAVSGPAEEVLDRLLKLRRKTSDKAACLKAILNENSNSRLLRRDGNFSAGLRIEPSRASFTIPRYIECDLRGKILFHPIVDGLGCSWGRCHFCTSARLFDRYYPRPPGDVVAEMDALVRQGVSFFRFTSSDTPLRHGSEIAQAILSQGLRVRYSMFTRAGRVTDERFKAYRLMIKSGLRAVFIGGETGHDLINQRVMNKGVSRQHIIDTIHGLRQAAQAEGTVCSIGLSLIYPCPTVDGISLTDVYRENVSLIREVSPDSVVVNPPAPFPGTVWFEEPDRFGFRMGNDFVEKLMRYEYAMYKPPELWPSLDVSLGGLTIKEVLKESGRLRREVASMGIPTEIPDEHLMMARTIGYSTKESLMEFKMNSLKDILTGGTEYSRALAERVAQAGRPCLP